MFLQQNSPKINLWILNNFLKYLKNAKNYSDHTVKSYEIDLLKFNNFLLEKKFSSWSDLRQADIRNFIGAYRRQGLSPRSVARILSSLRSFYKYLSLEGLTRENPILGISAPKLNSLLPRAVVADMVTKVVQF